MGAKPVGGKLIGAVDGIQLVIVMDGWVVMKGACEYQYCVGDAFGWSDGGMSEV